MLTDSSIGLVKSIESNVNMQFNKFLKTKPAFKNPCSSEYIDVYLASKKNWTKDNYRKRHTEKVCDMPIEKSVHSIANVIKVQVSRMTFWEFASVIIAMFFAA